MSSSFKSSCPINDNLNFVFNDDHLEAAHVESAINTVVYNIPHPGGPLDDLPYEEVLALFYVACKLPTEMHHDDFRFDLVVDEMGYYMRDQDMHSEVRIVCGEDAFNLAMKHVQLASLFQITGLSTKYRHSHTLRRDFVMKYSALYPAACKWLLEAEPSKTQIPTDLPLKGVESLAAQVFCGGTNVLLNDDVASEIALRAHLNTL